MEIRCWTRTGAKGGAFVEALWLDPTTVLLLASVRLVNMPARQWLDDRLFVLKVIHVEYWDDATLIPPHGLIVNAVGDADLCDEALTRAEALIAHSAAPSRSGIIVAAP